MNGYDKLAQLQSMPLEAKVALSTQRIRQWYDHWHGKVYVAFSGGKDSTVLLHLVRSLYPEVKAVFVDTGLEYPEIRLFVKSIDNVVWLRPKMAFSEVVRKYGYPVLGKSTAMTIRKLLTQNLSVRYRNKLMNGDERGTAGKLAEKWKIMLDAPFKISEQCCDVMKKNPIKVFDKEFGLKQFTGEMASESFNRTKEYNKSGCNAFDNKIPKSKPLSVWNDCDIWEYIESRALSYSSIYDTGVKRTGCMFCMFGVHLEKEPNRFQLMKHSHPKQWDYCINKLGCGEVLDYIGVDYGQQEEFNFNK